MNKIKTIYDVVKKMKDKDSFKGTLKAEGLKDQEKIFSVNNTFERSSKDGELHSFHEHHHGVYTVGVKEGVGRLMTVLGILSSIKLDENKDGSAVLTLKSADIPQDIRNTIHEKMKNAREQHKHMGENDQQHIFMKEFHDMENSDFALNVYINKDREIDRVTVDVKGEQKDDNNERHGMKLAAELCLEW
ncbi:MAG: hypothetical protein ACM3TR_05590 [Caulobacteraceae bacterium]